MPKTMTLEECAARMTAFLARPGRGRTKAYLATLPKRDKVIVTVDAYARDTERYQEWLDRGKPPSPPKTRRISARAGPTLCLMERMIEAQLQTCVLCGNALDIDADFHMSDPMRLSFDHVVPRARGGVNVGNRIAAHRDCNTRKADRMPTGCELIWLAVVNAVVK